MAHTVQNWETWAPEIAGWMKMEEKNAPKPVYEQLFGVTSTTRLQIPEVPWSGMQPMSPVSEMEDAVDDESHQGYKTTYDQQAYRASATFSSLMMRTDQSGKAKQIASEIARLPMYTRNLLAMSTFRRAWDGTKLGGDGQELVSLSHPKKIVGGTQANTFSDGVQLPLSYENALTLENQLNALVSDTGNLLNVGSEGSNKLLLCSHALREQAFQIAGIEAPDKEPDSAENNANYFKLGTKYNVLATKWLSYEAAVQAGETAVAKTSASNYWDSMWFILDMDLMKKYFKFFYLEGYYSFTEEITKANEALVKYAYDSFAYGYTSYIPVVGSKGDNSTYTG